MANTRVTVDENKGQVTYLIEHSFHSKEDFVQFISRFQGHAAAVGLAIILQEIPPTQSAKVDRL